MDNSAFLKQMQSDFDDSLDDIDEDLQTANGDPVVESIETVSTDSDTEIADVDDLDDVNPITTDISAPLNFSMDDFAKVDQVEETGIALQDDLDEDDSKLMLSYASKCKELGFPLTADSDLETAEALHKYATASYSSYNFSDFVSYYHEMVGQLSTSTAVHIPQMTSMLQLNTTLVKNIDDPDLKAFCSEACTMISSDILEQLQKTQTNGDYSSFSIKPEDISADDIYRRLRLSTNSNPAKYKVEVLNSRSQEIYAFINTAINAWLANAIADNTQTATDTARKEAVALALTKSAHEVIKKLAKSQFAYIKHIDAKNGGNLVCTCAKCGAKTKVTSLMQLLFFPNNSKNQRFVFPANNICKCGSLLIFPLHCYLAASNFYSENNKSSLKSMIEASRGFGKGANLLIVSPSLRQLPIDITCIATDAEVPLIQSKEQVVEIYDSEEWKKAVDDFYSRVTLLKQYKSVNENVNKLKTVQNQLVTKDGFTQSGYNLSANYNTAYDIKMPDTIKVDTSYLSLLAANVAQIAGVDYNLTKGKALASLLTFLGSNDILQQQISLDNLMMLNASLALVEQYKDPSKYDFNKLSKGVLNNLLLVAAQINPEISMPEDANDLRDFLNSNIIQLRNNVWMANNRYTQYVQQLDNAKYALACLPIVDYQQISVFKLIQNIPNEQIFDVINEICDLMIINMYSDQYFNYWCREDYEHVRTLKTRLQTSADVKSIANAVSDVINDVFSTYGVYKTDHYFSNVTASSLGRWEHLKQLTDLANSGNYYRFCCEAKVISQDDYGFGKSFNDGIRSFVLDNLKEFTAVTSYNEVHYYLSGMFTEDELQQNATDFEFLAFGRFIPKRKANETPESYIARFKAASATAVDCIDNYDNFKKIQHLSSVILGSSFAEAKFQNFRVANFVAGMFDSVFATHSKESLALIGISDLRYSSLVASIKPWTFSDFNINNIDILALVNAYYFTDADMALANALDTLMKCYFVASSSVTTLDTICDFDSVLMDSLQQVSASSDSGASVQDMVEEMRCWEYTDGYVERFAGE